MEPGESSEGSTVNATSLIGTIKIISKLCPENSGILADHLVYVLKGMTTTNLGNLEDAYASLVTVLRNIPSSLINWKKFTTLVENELQNEELAKLLAYGTLIESELILQFSEEEKIDVLKKICTLQTNHETLNLIACSFMNMFISIENDGITFESIEGPVRESLLNSKQNLTIGGLQLLVTLRKKFNCRQTKKLCKHILGSTEPICESSSKTVAKILMLPHSKMYPEHPFYYTVCEEIFRQPEIVATVWSNLDKELNETTPLKENVLLILFRHFLKIIDSSKSLEMVPIFLTNNLVRMCLMKKRNKQPPTCRSVYFELIAVVNKSSPDVKLSVLSALLFYPGELSFDHITGTKTTSEILHNLPNSGVRQLVETFSNILTNQQKKLDESHNEVPWTKKDLLSCTQFLSRLINHKECSDDIAWLKKLLTMLLDLSLFSAPAEMNPEISRAIADCFFNGILRNYSSFHDHLSVMTHLVKHLDKKIKTMSEDCVMRSRYNNQVAELWKFARQNIVLRDMKKEETLFSPVFTLLVCHLGLMLFKDSKVVCPVLSELFILLNTNIENQTNGRQNWPVIMDLLLKLLSKNVYPYRYMVRCAFKYFAPHITQDVLQQVLKIFHVEPTVDSDPLEKDVSNQDDDEESSNQDDEEEELNQDDDDDEEEEEEEASNQEDSEEEDTDCEDDSGIDVQVKKMSDAKSAQELSMENSETNSENGEDSINLDDITEEDGKLLNDALSHAFSIKSSHNEQLKDDKKHEEFLHFRLRVLDLLDILIDAKPSLNNIMECVRCLFELLLELIKTKKDDVLQLRLRGWLNKVATIKEIPHTEEVFEEKELCKTLEAILKDEKQIGYPIFIDLQSVIISISKFLLRAHINFCEHYPQDTSSGFSDLFLACLLKNDTRRSCVISFQLTKMAIEIGWDGVVNVMPNITQLCFYGIKTQKIKSIELLLLFCKNSRAYNYDSLSKFPKTNKEIRHTLLKGLMEIFGNGKNHNIPNNFYIILWDILLTLHKRQLFKLNWEKIKEMLEMFLTHQTTNHKTPKLSNLCKILKIEKPIISTRQTKEQKAAQHNGTVDTNDSTQNLKGKSKKDTSNRIQSQSTYSLELLNKENEFPNNTEMIENSSELNQCEFNVDNKDNRKRGHRNNVLQLKKKSKLRRLEVMSGLEKTIFTSNLLDSIALE